MWILLIFNGALAIIPGIIARQRGFGFFRYWGYSFFFSILLGMFISLFAGMVIMVPTSIILAIVLCKKTEPARKSDQYIPLDSLKNNSNHSTAPKSKESLNQPAYCGDCGKPGILGKKFCVFCGSSLSYE